MIPNITIGAFVFGAVLLLISLLGGKFKIFGAEIPGTVSRKQRCVAGTAGVFFTLIALILCLPIETIQTFLNIKARGVVSDLSQNFNQARDNLRNNGTADFSKTEKLIKDLPPENGHALYFSGEIKRIRDTNHFTSKSCIKMPLPNNFDLNEYHDDFNKYLNIAATINTTKIEGVGSSICYERVNGYCLERIAWINHLLANDFYEEAMALSDPMMKQEKLKTALEHAKKAIGYQPPNKTTPGFDQCVPTRKLINDIDIALNKR